MKKGILICICLVGLFIACQSGNNENIDIDKHIKSIDSKNKQSDKINIVYEKENDINYLKSEHYSLDSAFFSKKFKLIRTGYLNSTEIEYSNDGILLLDSNVRYKVEGCDLVSTNIVTGEKKILIDNSNSILSSFLTLTNIEYTFKTKNGQFLAINAFKNWSDFLVLYNVDKNEVDFDYFDTFYGTDFLDKMKNEEYDYYSSLEGRYAYTPYPMCFDDCIVVRESDLRMPHFATFYAYDVVTHEKKEIIDEFGINDLYYEMANTMLYDDDHLYISLEIPNVSCNQYAHKKSGIMYILSKSSMGIVGEIELSAISEYTPQLIKIEDEKMYFYDSEESALKLVDFSKGIGSDIEINNVIGFNRVSKYVGYDELENQAIIRLNYISDDYKNSKIVYAYYNFDTGETGVIQEVWLDELVDSISGLEEVYEYLVGDYIFVDYLMVDASYDFAGGITGMKIQIR